MVAPCSRRPGRDKWRSRQPAASPAVPAAPYGTAAGAGARAEQRGRFSVKSVRDPWVRGVGCGVAKVLPWHTIQDDDITNFPDFRHQSVYDLEEGFESVLFIFIYCVFGIHNVE